MIKRYIYLTLKRVKYFIIIFLLIACKKPDNSQPNDFGLFTEHTIVIDGLTRNYDFYIPSYIDSMSVPLIFMLHGGSLTSDDLTGKSGLKAPYKVWMDIAEKEKFIIVYPNGAISPLGKQGWNDCREDATTNPSVDDVSFIDSLISHFSNTYNINTNQIYATGTSNGGHMALRLALELSHKIAAVAPIAASMPADICNNPNNPISVLFMVGTDDPLSPYIGGEVAPNIGGRGTVLSVEESVSFWINFNQTDSIPFIENFQDINTTDNSSVRSTTYSNGIESTQVALYDILGGGHLEPSIQEQYSTQLESVLGNQNHDIEMALIIWNFFSDKTLN
ncbi:alpha/beta hydrolase family esterase [Xanthomarina sp. F2636L]|uniref:alpha/beta hydrolase family esterase n=1 Tax=Xanthomarina sp. F2636L TaxID=2996018 RepID=UPI00225E0BA0|nr:PHB depolymerase family esterase [Xanthomarina sp. F2636L]MCX7550239.1 hypothetical protein [Xanthomarina sp. F2636L]